MKTHHHQASHLAESTTRLAAQKFKRVAIFLLQIEGLVSNVDTSPMPIGYVKPGELTLGINEEPVEYESANRTNPNSLVP